MNKNIYLYLMLFAELLAIRSQYSILGATEIDQNYENEVLDMLDIMVHYRMSEGDLIRLDKFAKNFK